MSLENQKVISILTKRVNEISARYDDFSLSLEEIKETQVKLMNVVQKIYDKVYDKPRFLSVGEVALDQGVSEKTVLRRINDGTIPSEKKKGEKSHRIPSLEYFKSVSHDGNSKWFSNHS